MPTQLFQLLENNRIPSALRNGAACISSENLIEADNLLRQQEIRIVRVHHNKWFPLSHVVPLENLANPIEVIGTTIEGEDMNLTETRRLVEFLGILAHYVPIKKYESLASHFFIDQEDVGKFNQLSQLGRLKRV